MYSYLRFLSSSYSFEFITCSRVTRQVHVFILAEDGRRKNKEYYI